MQGTLLMTFEHVVDVDVGMLHFIQTSYSEEPLKLKQGFVIRFYLIFVRLHWRKMQYSDHSRMIAQIPKGRSFSQGVMTNRDYMTVGPSTCHEIP